ncbi:YbaK/EbsC family protein [bacterium]|nr:YbaK/EbsC family protein [bacterium]
MAIPKKLIKFLDKARVKYEIIQHRTVYTAFDKAKTLKVPEKIIGKTLVMKLEGPGKKFVFALIPGNKNLDKGKFKETVNKWQKRIGEKVIRTCDFATEIWMKKNLKGVKVGAIPPFGSLWKLPTFVDKGLMKSSKIIVSAGNYNFSFKISPANLKKLLPDLIIGSFSQAKKKTKRKKRKKK